MIRETHVRFLLMEEITTTKRLLGVSQGSPRRFVWGCEGVTFKNTEILVAPGKPKQAPHRNDRDHFN